MNNDSITDMITDAEFQNLKTAKITCPDNDNVSVSLGSSDIVLSSPTRINQITSAANSNTSVTLGSSDIVLSSPVRVNEITSTNTPTSRILLSGDEIALQDGNLNDVLVASSTGLNVRQPLYLEDSEVVYVSNSGLVLRNLSSTIQLSLSLTDFLFMFSGVTKLGVTNTGLTIPRGYEIRQYTDDHFIKMNVDNIAMNTAGVNGYFEWLVNGGQCGTLSDKSMNLSVPLVSSVQPTMIRRTSGSQTIPNSGGPFNALYDTLVYSKGTGITYSAGAFTFTVAGTYLVTYEACWQPDTADPGQGGNKGYRSLYLSVTGDTFRYGALQFPGIADIVERRNGSAIIYIGQNQTMTLKISHNSTTNNLGYGEAGVNACEFNITKLI